MIGLPLGQFTGDGLAEHIAAHDADQPLLLVAVQVAVNLVARLR
jgi:hypothetical protein